MNHTDWCTIPDAARCAHVTTDTIRRWVRSRSVRALGKRNRLVHIGDVMNARDHYETRRLANLSA